MCFPSRIGIMPIYKMFKSTEIEVVEWCHDLPHRTINNRVLVNFHVELTPARFIDSFEKACTYFKKSQLTLWDAVCQNVSEKMISVVHPETDIAVFRNFR